MKILGLAFALAIAGFGQTLDSIGGGKFELSGTIDRPVFVNHSGQTVIYVAVLEECENGWVRINRWFIGIVPETVIVDGANRELDWDKTTWPRAMRSPVNAQFPPLSGEFFGDDRLGSYGNLLGRLRAFHSAIDAADAGNWDPINSDYQLYRYLRPVSPERRKVLIDYYRSLPVKLWKAE